MSIPETPTWTSKDTGFMQRALVLAQQAEKHGEVPVGAVLVLDDKIIGEGFNQPIGQHDPTAHAEIQAIRAASIRQGNYRLPNSALFVTLEPCAMCAGAIIHARINRVVFATADPRSGAAGGALDLLPGNAAFNHAVEIESGLLAVQSAQLLRAFFKARR